MPEEKIVEHCLTVKSECSKGLAEKIMATKHDGYNILVKVALKDDHEKASLAAVQVIHKCHLIFISNALQRSSVKCFLRIGLLI